MRRRGMTLVELMTAMGVIALVFFGMTSLFVGGLKSFKKTSQDTVLAQRNAQGIRRVVESIRQAAAVELSYDGQTITYYLPTYSNFTDPDTGERELIVPVVSDGVPHRFHVAGTELIEDDTGRILVESIYPTDPDPNSSQYGQSYMPFQMTTIGSSRAVSINLITSEVLAGDRRYVRMKTTAILRNSR